MKKVVEKEEGEENVRKREREESDETGMNKGLKEDSCSSRCA